MRLYKTQYEWSIDRERKYFVNEINTALKLHWNCHFDLQPFGVHLSSLYGYKSWNVFIKNLNFFSTEEKKYINILDDMRVSKLSGNFNLKVN